MKKEAVILGFIVVGALAFVIGRRTGDEGADSAPAKGGEAAKTESAKSAMASATDSDIIPVGASAVQGGGDTALVTIVAFSDFQCPFCSRVLPTMKQLEEKYGDKVRVTFKHNPLPFHKDAPYASKAAIAAGKQGKFWEMHDKLFANQRALAPEAIEGYAKEIGLNVDQWKKDIADPATQKQIEEDQALGVKVGARGTPNFLINGKQLSGAQPFEKFDELVGEQIKAAEDEIKAGTKPDAVYAALVKKNFKAPSARPTDRQPSAPDAKTVYKIPVGTSYAKGAKEPLVTIIEFSEFQCPFCSRVLPTTKQIVDEYGDKVRIVFKHAPLPFHKDAPYASQAALAAGEQGKFWEMHDKLFANQRALSPEAIEGYDKELGLDVAKFKADADSEKIKKVIQEDQALAAQFGARGTPNFFINGRQLVGAQPFAAFKGVMDEEIKKAEDLIKGGTDRASVYEKLTAGGQTKAAAPTPRARPSADDKTVYKVPVNPADPVKGPNDAFVTIVEFSDFQCPFCSRVGPALKQIEETYGNDVRVVFKQSPLPFHKDAPYAAEAALAAGKQGKFWEMHDKLFANQRALAPEAIEGYAKEIGLDVGKWKADIAAGWAKKQIQADQELARGIGAGGTPNFFINGRKLVGAQPFDSFKKVIDEELVKAKALAAKGTPKAGLYAELIKDGATKPAGPAPRPKEDDNKIYEVKVNPSDAVKGPANAKVTIIEFSEFQCPFCSRVLPTLEQVRKEYGDQVRIVFKHNPLSFHKDAPYASEASLAAGAQGKFWEMHDMLYKNQRALSAEDIDKYAQEIGLNLAKFKADLSSGKFKAQIEADQALARELGASGTPSFFINGKKLRGAQPFEQFKQVIDEALKK